MNKATKIIVTIGIVIAFMVITVALQLFAEEGGRRRPHVFIVMLIMYGAYGAIKAVWKKKKTDDQDDQDTPVLQ